ncbi:DJ-1/PfpI family protein [Nitrincola sp. A-D6]|uniref:DJ-1/PfpI family protein n=1 Tax=Nitrincola sp. A-D6 TaxID=1545442 RepID=UPI00190F0A89|nr:DJ-1/PfpI family protein [Nitrincola sp. A-D6]
MFVAASGEKIEAGKSLENAPGVLFDALVLPDGRDAVQLLAGNADAQEFIKNVCKHGKTLLALGAGQELLEMAGIKPSRTKDAGILLAESTHVAEIIPAFMDAIAAHRHPDRESETLTS